MEPFVIAFLATFVAEMGDRTQMTTLIMSSRYSPCQVFAGAITALALVTGLGVALGELVAGIFPAHLVAPGSGLLFIFMGIYFYLKRDDLKKTNAKGKSAMVLDFSPCKLHPTAAIHN